MTIFVALAIAVAQAAPAAPSQGPNPAGSTRAPANDPRRAILDAMAAELVRSMAELRLKDHEPPYFISYQLRETHQHQITGRYGAVFDDDTRRDRQIAVDVRVGSYDFDNSGDTDFDFGGGGATYPTRKDAPLDDDPRALKNALWLVTDEKYKSALTAYLKKKGKAVYTVDEPDRPPSFSREEPQRFVQPSRPFPFDRARWIARTRELGAMFRDHPAIFDSDVRVSADKRVRYLVTGEGAAILTEDTLYAVHVQGVTRADDGQLLESSRDFYAAAETGLPGAGALKSEVAALIGELLALRTAPVLDPYTGPAILSPEATGVFFHETVGHRLEGERQNDEKEGRTFKGQVGQIVIPPFLSVVDDPTLQNFEGRSLNGHYQYDDEGVPAQRAGLIENGVLRAYLLSRRPVKGFVRSNGHGRSQGTRPAVARMASTMVLSAKPVPDVELKRMLLAEVRRQTKPYGLLIRDIAGGNTNTSNYGYQAFKGQPRMVYRVDAKDGREELVRGVEIVGTPLATINKIIATGATSAVFNGFCGAESGPVPVSTIAPAALIAEIELQRNISASEKPPIIRSPWVAEPTPAAPATQRAR